METGTGTGSRTATKAPAAAAATARRTCFVTGYAKLPAGITASDLSKMVGVALELDPADGRIVRADCTLATRLAREFVASLLEGHRLREDMELMVREIESRYYGSAQKPLIAALRIALERFESRGAGRDSREAREPR